MAQTSRISECPDTEVCITHYIGGVLCKFHQHDGILILNYKGKVLLQCDNLFGLIYKSV